ncbi:GIY-YIG nuclease family protein [Pedobacter sp. AW1-32]|uniref:GIY-YIG nuclease family protein n=1 Tax=Pedobacter sp. AW1-32 TaxID=3383026 RepID=UPI003FED5D8F
MAEFYYQIKGKKGKDDYFGNWTFPPIFSGKVVADDKKKAKLLIDAEYGKQFPLRVLQKDLDSNEFLLNIDEIKPDSHISRLFELNTCKRPSCNNTFYVIDKYNDHNCGNKGQTYCSYECQDEDRQIQAYIRNQNEVLSGTASPVIYKITNKITSLCYIGKTTQVFTLRWYQHFFQHGSCKFHLAIRSSKVTDWTFEIIEIVEIPNDIKTVKEIEQLISTREKHHIKENNSVMNGYNSIN